MKNQILESIKEHHRKICLFYADLKKCKTSTIHKKTHQELAKQICAEWFDAVKPLLEKVSFSEDIIKKYSSDFEKILDYSRKVSKKNSYLQIFNKLQKSYLSDISHQIEINNYVSSNGLSISPYIEELEDDEKEYLKEAAQCAKTNCIRASILLGWCATINKIHKKIEELGFDKFNKANTEMKSRNYGRFKRYNKEYTINSLSELREVFDTDLLWIIEFMGLIDSNQHERLRYCFLLRNNSGHPGEAPISGENLYAFYSDITKIVLKNKKFQIVSAN